MIGLSSREGAVVDAILEACRRAFDNLINLAIVQKMAFVVIAYFISEINPFDHD